MKPLILALIFTALAFGQTPVPIPAAVISPVPYHQFLDGNGKPIVGGLLCTYQSGTTSGSDEYCPDGVPLATYTSAAGTTPNANPVVTDSNGRVRLFLGAGAYKMVLKTAASAAVWTADGIYEPSFNFLKGLQSVGTDSVISHVATGTGAVTRSVRDKLSESVSVKDFGAIGDGSSHPVSSWCSYSGGTRYTAASAGACLTAVQVDYPHVTAVGNEIDWAAIQSGVVQEETINGRLTIPCGTYLINRTIAISERVEISGAGGGDNANGCSIVKKTADVVGISIASGSDGTVLQDFVLWGTASTGTSSGITIGGIDATNGAGRVVLRNVAVLAHKGHGIDVLNGNAGTMDNVYAVGNGGDGVHLYSQHTSAWNVNAWRINGLSAGSNTGHGLYMAQSVANIVSGLDSESNTGYGLYVNGPSSTINGYVENNTAGSYYLGTSAYECFIAIRDTDNEPTIVNPNNFVFQQSGIPTFPYLNPITGRMTVNGAFASQSTVVTYSPSMALNANSGNEFNITATDGVAFAVGCPTNPNYPGQRVTIRIINGHTAALGAVTWCTKFTMSGWVNPSPGFSRSVDLQLAEDEVHWIEVNRPTVDAGTLYGIPATTTSMSTGRIDHPFIYWKYSRTGLTSTNSYSSNPNGGVFPSLAIETMYRACGQIVVTSTATAGTRTATLKWLPHNPNLSYDGVATVDLTAAGATASTCSTMLVPASTSTYYFGDFEEFVNNDTGVVSVHYVIERIW